MYKRQVYASPHLENKYSLDYYIAMIMSCILYESEVVWGEDDTNTKFCIFKLIYEIICVYNSRKNINVIGVHNMF